MSHPPLAEHAAVRRFPGVSQWERAKHRIGRLSELARGGRRAGGVGTAIERVQHAQAEVRMRIWPEQVKAPRRGKRFLRPSLVQRETVLGEPDVDQLRG